MVRSVMAIASVALVSSSEVLLASSEVASHNSTVSNCGAAAFAYCCHTGTPCNCNAGIVTPGQCGRDAYNYCCGTGTPCMCAVGDNLADTKEVAQVVVSNEPLLELQLSEVIDTPLTSMHGWQLLYDTFPNGGCIGNHDCKCPGGDLQCCVEQSKEVCDSTPGCVSVAVCDNPRSGWYMRAQMFDGTGFSTHNTEWNLYSASAISDMEQLVVGSNAQDVEDLLPVEVADMPLTSSDAASQNNTVSNCGAAAFAYCCHTGTPCNCNAGIVTPGQCGRDAYNYCCGTGTPCMCAVGDNFLTV